MATPDIVADGLSMTIGWGSYCRPRYLGMFLVGNRHTLAWGKAWDAYTEGRPWDEPSTGLDGVREFATKAEMVAYFDRCEDRLAAQK